MFRGNLSPPSSESEMIRARKPRASVVQNCDSYILVSFDKTWAHRQEGNLINLLLFLQNKVRRLENEAYEITLLSVYPCVPPLSLLGNDSVNMFPSQCWFRMI
jgi:hypothetical protein